VAQVKNVVNMTGTQALRCPQDRPSGQYNVAEMRSKISRFKQAAEGIGGLVVDDKMRGHPAVNKKLCEAVLAVTEAFGRDDSGPEGRRLRFKHTFKDGAEFKICTWDHAQRQGWSDTLMVSLGLFAPVNDPRIRNVEAFKAVSLRNPGHGNAVDMKPHIVLNVLAKVVKELEGRLPR
jgi:hypothetical protein